VLSEKCFSKCNSLYDVRFESDSRLSRIENREFAETGLIELVIPPSVELLGEGCFVRCGSLISLAFESGSRLSRIEKQAFARTSVIELVIPAPVELLGEGCFLKCESLTSLTFESGSRLFIHLFMGYSFQTAVFDHFTKVKLFSRPIWPFLFLISAVQDASSA
jgi:hypothetical protein